MECIQLKIEFDFFYKTNKFEILTTTTKYYQSYAEKKFVFVINIIRV